ncbi:MAG: tRNA pseudouridine(38-40) synthase TruA [Candidatus Puniceispirillum sp.]|nr:tRNA pseudouridine(38-40) synthase TruA [Candidatus Pelagibacter sp.]MBA4283230.1 tRNA pseudouridine(38-40) synthase TruA [Candidatus Puniceispirillum sp.]
MNSFVPIKYRYAFRIEYKGEHFFGWQKQQIQPTVQEVLENHLKIILKPLAPTNWDDNRILIEGSGRTDTGVNAYGQMAHFDSPILFNTHKIISSLNFFLRPYESSITWMGRVASDFHARFSAVSRSYVYEILNTQYERRVQFSSAWHINKPLNLNAMKKAAMYLVGRHDFESFRDQQCQAKSAIRNIDAFDIKEHQGLIQCYVQSKSFLHHQIRIMVGTLTHVGLGKLSPEDIPVILEKKHRKFAGPTAPPGALIFLGPIYSDKYKIPPLNTNWSKTDDVGV